MISAYRAQLYRWVFSLAALYNIAFGLWAGLWPRSFFDRVEIAAPNYPSLWSCLGMVVGLYGLLYAYAAVRLERAWPIIFVGLVGKVLGPIGWFTVIHSGEWPLRTLPLIVFNDLIWWLPFALFLLDETRPGALLRHAAPWACAALNACAAGAMLFCLRRGTVSIPSLDQRATYITSHLLFWRGGWIVWMMAALTLVAFYAWWGGRISSSRTATVAFLLAALGLVCDWLAEALFIGWLPAHLAALSSLGTFLSGALANALYTVAGVILTIGTRSLGKTLRVWAWGIWITGFALTACTLLGNIAGMTFSTGLLLCLLCPWVAFFGWKTVRDS